jgi:hypothetical protein
LLKISSPFSFLDPATREAWLTGAELADPVTAAELDGEELLQAASISATALAAASADPTRNSDVFVIPILHGAISCRL